MAELLAGLLKLEFRNMFKTKRKISASTLSDTSCIYKYLVYLMYWVWYEGHSPRDLAE